MLRDVIHLNTVLRSMHLLFVSILNIFVCTAGHFESEFSFATDSVSQISFKAQIARSQHPMPIRASVPFMYRHWVSSASFAARILQADAQLTVTAVIPHPVARRVQTQATSDPFL
jgi:hypothetical protein